MRDLGEILVRSERSERFESYLRDLGEIWVRSERSESDLRDLGEI